MRPKKILIVDDEPQIRLLLGTMLRNRGYKVLEADEAVQAMHLVIEERPDAIILDAMLPGTSGAKLCRAIKNDPQLSEIPVAILSGLFQGDGEVEFYLGEAAQADAYLAKPINLAQFLGETRRLLGEA